jgi:hypothetical protein
MAGREKRAAWAGLWGFPRVAGGCGRLRCRTTHVALDAGARGGRHGGGGLAVLPRRCDCGGLSRWPDVPKGGRRRSVHFSTSPTLCELHKTIQIIQKHMDFTVIVQEFYKISLIHIKFK